MRIGPVEVIPLDDRKPKLPISLPEFSFFRNSKNNAMIAEAL